MDEIYELFNVSGVQDDFFDFALSDAMVDAIKTKYISFLKTCIADTAYTDMYEEKLLSRAT